MFIRIYKRPGNKEVLVNIDHISVLEVTYSVQRHEREFYGTTAEYAADNPEAVRMYRFVVGGEKFLLAASNPDDPVIRVIGEIYNKAVKA